MLARVRTLVPQRGGLRGRRARGGLSCCQPVTQPRRLCLRGGQRRAALVARRRGRG